MKKYTVRVVLLDGTEGVNCRCGKPAAMHAQVYGGEDDGKGGPECSTCGAVWLAAMRNGRGTRMELKRDANGMLRPVGDGEDR